MKFSLVTKTNKLKNNVSILILLISLVACGNQRKEHIREILGSGCFWDVADNEINVKKAVYTYRLLPDGTCYNYVGQEKQTSVLPENVSIGEIDIRWRVENDSLVKIANVVYKVGKIDNTSVWLESPDLESILLIKNCKTFIND